MSKQLAPLFVIPVLLLMAPAYGYIVGSPLDQLKDGTPLDDILCKNEFVLVYTDQRPACVSTDTATTLEMRGWSVIGPTESPQIIATDDPVLTGAVDIGVLLHTSVASSHGNDNAVAIKKAVDDFNEYLKNKGALWSINLISKDTMSNKTITLQKTQEFNEEGIKMILGAQSSAEVKEIQEYVTQNNMIVISPSSTSPALVQQDTIFRFAPDDTKQSKAIVALLENFGVTDLVPIYRDDVWGQGLYSATIQEFEEIGGNASEAIKLEPKSSELANEAALVANTVSAYIDDGNDADKIAILLIGTSEAVHFMNHSSSHDILSTIRWVGSDGSADDEAITMDSTLSKFAQDAKFLATQFGPLHNEVYDTLRADLTEELGYVPNNYAYSAYDSLWVLGKTIDMVQSTDTILIAKNLPVVASEHIGSIGDIKLNDAGDLEVSNYELWGVDAEGQWVIAGNYIAESDSVSINPAYSANNVIING